RKIQAGEAVPIYPGTRYWLHADSHADAILFLLKRKELERCHIRGEVEISNRALAELIASALDLPLKVQDVTKDLRLGHEARYCLDGSKLTEMGWKVPVD